MRFDFATVGRILFGPGVFSQTAELALSLGKKPLLVSGRRREHLVPLVGELEAAGAAVTRLTVTGEPDTGTIGAGLELARRCGCDVVIAVGGGSVLDTGKAIAGLLRQDGELLDYLEVIGRAKPLSGPPTPCLAVPTTAGTGAEVTCNSVIASPEHKVKVSLRHPSLFPAMALVDPELTYSLPPAETAASGLDALTQLIEPFVSIAANPITDALCLEGINRAGRSLLRVFTEGSDPQAREDMSLAGLFSGLALANAKLGAVHGLAGPLGGLTGAPHGRLCASILPAVMETNIRLLRKRGDNPAALDKYRETACLLTGHDRARAEDGAAWVRDLCGKLGIQGLQALGFQKADTKALVEKALQASSMKGNPVKLTADEITGIIEMTI
jgi:alcohol dehydrogenase class IV